LQQRLACPAAVLLALLLWLLLQLLLLP
jgi:hypothetical protein